MSGVVSLTAFVTTSRGSTNCTSVESRLGATPVPVAVAEFVFVCPNAVGAVFAALSSTSASNVIVTVFPPVAGFTTVPRLNVMFCPTTVTLDASSTKPLVIPAPLVTVTEPAANWNPAGSTSAICTLFVVPSTSVSVSV